MYEQDNKELAKSQFNVLGNSSYLTLKGTPGDSGLYSCRLSNNLGESYVNFTVSLDASNNEKVQLAAYIVPFFLLLVIGFGLSLKFILDKVNKLLFFIFIMHCFCFYNKCKEAGNLSQCEKTTEW